MNFVENIIKILPRCRDQLNPDAADMVELKVQTRDRRESVNIKVGKGRVLNCPHLYLF